MYSNLIISGGATKTLAVLGAIKYLNEHNKLKNIRNFIGTSAGSILCFMLALHYTIDEIKTHIVTNLLNEKVHEIDLDGLIDLNIFTSFGIDTGKKIEQFLKKVLFHKLKVHDINFIDFAKLTGNHLVICVANLTKQQPEHFNMETHPDCSVIEAIRMSIAIPIIFTPIHYKDCLYIDGGLYESFPISYVEKYKDPLQDTIAINTVVLYNDIIPTNFFEYMFFMFISLLEKVNTKIEHSPKLEIVQIVFQHQDMQIFDIQNLGFHLSLEKIEQLEKIGYDEIKKHFEKQNS